MTERLEHTTDLDLAAIEQLAVDCAQAGADVVELRRELHDARVALDEQRRMSAMFLKQAGEMKEALISLTRDVLFYPEWFNDEAQSMGCDAGNPDGGSVKECMHCEFQQAALHLTRAIDRSIAALGIKWPDDAMVILGDAALAATEAGDGE